MPFVYDKNALLATLCSYSLFENIVIVRDWLNNQIRHIVRNFHSIILTYLFNYRRNCKILPFSFRQNLFICNEKSMNTFPRWLFSIHRKIHRSSSLVLAVPHLDQALNCGEGTPCEERIVFIMRRQKNFFYINKWYLSISPWIIQNIFTINHLQKKWIKLSYSSLLI